MDNSQKKPLQIPTPIKKVQIYNFIKVMFLRCVFKWIISLGQNSKPLRIKTDWEKKKKTLSTLPMKKFVGIWKNLWEKRIENLDSRKILINNNKMLEQ